MDVIRFNNDWSFQWHVTGGWERNFSISHVWPAAGADKAVRLERDAIQMDRQMPWVGHIQWLIKMAKRRLRSLKPLLRDQKRKWSSFLHKQIQDVIYDTGSDLFTLFKTSQATLSNMKPKTLKHSLCAQKRQK